MYPFRNTPIRELMSACVERNDSAAWVEFVRRTQPLVAGVAAKTARKWGERDPAVIEELVQEAYSELVSRRLLQDFQHRHTDAIFGYLKVVVANLVHDLFKASHSAKRGGGLRPVELDGLEAESGGESAQSVEDSLLLDEIETTVRQGSSGREIDRDLLIFQLYYRLGLSAPAIASIPCLELTLKGVESLLHRITRQARAVMAGIDPAKGNRNEMSLAKGGRT